MIKILFFTQRSLFVIFLVSSAVYAESNIKALVKENTLYTQQNTCNIHQELENILVAKGLESDISNKKVSKLLKNNKSDQEKLFLLQTKLQISKEKIFEALAFYALHEDELDLNSYSSLIGFVQKIKLSLDSRELALISDIAKV